MHRRPEFPRVFDKESRPLAQDPVNIRLVQQHGNLNEPVKGSDLQLLLLPAAERWGQLNPKDGATGTPHHTAKFVFCLGQTGHISHSRKQESPPAFRGRRFVGTVSAAL
jgi:hypothetical protein